MKKLIIHDGGVEFEEQLKAQLKDPENYIFITEKSEIHGCIGCFACWVKTPTKCALKDEYNCIQDSYSKCDEMIVVSECCYGMYSPFVKNVMDRAISYLQPFFEKRNGEMHHKMRYGNVMNMQVHYYGPASDKEKETAKALAERNVLNFNSTLNGVHFWDSKDDVKLNL